MSNNQPDQLRAAAEAELARAPDAMLMPRPAEKLLHELRVHQIELEMQNETLRQAQIELEQSRDRYLDLYDFAPVAYMTLTPEQVIIEINLTGATLLGVLRGKFVVEDDALTAAQLQKYIEEMDYQFAGTADNAEAALEQIAQTKPDLVLMNIRLNGAIDVVQAAARLHGNHAVAVIYLTAYADNDIFIRAKLTEPFGYLLKPFNRQELKACIEMALYKSEMEARLAEQFDELRRFNAIFMEREMRVIEVKREVNELLEQAGQPPRYHSVE